MHNDIEAIIKIIDMTQCKQNYELRDYINSISYIINKYRNEEINTSTKES